MGCLIVFKSITHAQKAYQILSKRGILAQLIRAPTHLGQGSCGYALKVSREDCGKLSKMLSGCDAGGFYKLSPSGAVLEVGL